MKLTLTIDSVPHQIDSTDPELLAKWIVEIFGRIRQITPATWIEFRVFPSFVPADRDGIQPWQPDWVADSRVICQDMHIRSPRELLTELGRQLDALGALNDR